ncbi:MAG: hypothetical protein IJG36_01630 [Synergistaceae bacterium]|nr:hypothetical protein [Synergistaceae bacterium]MBQ6002906.1 hypothetical protein [Synergistaceae bacterium]MBR0167136.1 hypothetical protein [Synergistaceae bacterium]
MKRLLSAVLLTLILAGSAFGLSDREYLKMKRSSKEFARADRNLTRVWNRLEDRMPGWAFKILRDEQRDWINGWRDEDARMYMEKGYSRVEAYTMATDDRAEYLPKRARAIINGD